MRHSRVLLAIVGILAGALIAVSPTGCKKSQPPDSIQAGLEVLPNPNKFDSSQFRFAFTLRYRVSQMTHFGDIHRFDLVVRDQQDRVVSPSVERSWALQGIYPTNFSGRGTLQANLKEKLGVEGSYFDKMYHSYGRHTLDILTKAWDLKPGRYTLYGRLYTTTPATTKPTESNGQYWQCDVNFAPVQIEVTTDVTTQPVE